VVHKAVVLVKYPFIVTVKNKPSGVMIFVWKADAAVVHAVDHNVAILVM
jgi:hypothetical protein